ncbi:hypothetical protein EI42_04802 [Thermosporothrix hazakensis]|jgi:hypothetical protein|uniref:ABC-2 family transporter n=1 Tax=Thermosporothrix hazakensis TaxID=644383 RepID=A0A326UA18_THEHA|nr:ABC transporter permease [Thermosporothrix hazakensis]PZW24111.1 hypothetical protein EI42_04802 [Thermosporothrix hazakensis]GCE50323.1 hypothetical protein KTH_51920 [Thermosporothrix hazakensis]
MIWLIWRHYRWMLVLGILALLILMALFALNVSTMNAAYQQPNGAHCLQKGDCNLVVLPGLTTRTWYSLVFQSFPLLPFVVGIFLGAPLLAREYEKRTHLFVWTQSMSRTRWLSTNLMLLGSAVVLGFGALSLVATWWSFVQDATFSFSPWSTFMIRGSVLVANVLFGLLFGVMIGAIVRRVLPAMVITLVLLIPLQIAIWNGYPYLFPPSSQLEYNWKIVYGEVVGILNDRLDDLILSRETVGADGQTPINVLDNPCPDDKLTGEALRECNEKNFHELVKYHRFNEHFWPLQLATTALLLTLAALCTGVTYWRVRR